MPFGAHETMETHEILMEKINMISHFNLYEQQAKNPRLRDLIVRHRQTAIASYNEMVAYTHNYNQFRPIPANTNLQGVQPQQIQYGLHNPAPIGPESNAEFSDREIAAAILLCHKNGSRSANWAALECADPHLRRMMMNSAENCANQAYETFLFMNEQGTYQVPTLNDHTAKTFMHSYQPADRMQNMYAGAGSGMGAGNMGMGMGIGMGAGQTGGQNLSGSGMAGQSFGMPGMGIQNMNSQNMNSQNMNSQNMNSQNMNNQNMNSQNFGGQVEEQAGRGGQSMANPILSQSGMENASAAAGSRKRGAQSSATSVGGGTAGASVPYGVGNLMQQ